MSKKQFKTESKRLLDLMINSIYTNKEIFLRELISNASDALDKRHYLSLTDSKYASEKPLEINLSVDKENRTLTISDNGIGMNKSESNWITISVRLPTVVRLTSRTNWKAQMISILLVNSVLASIQLSWWLKR